MSSTVLIAVAVVAFVLLVSLQALESWPLAGSPGTSENEAPAATRTGSPAKATAAVPRPGEPAAARRRAARRDRQRAAVGSAPAATNPATGARGPDSPGSGGGNAPAAEPSTSGGDAPATRPQQAPAPLDTVAGTVNGTVAEAEQTLGEAGLAGTAEAGLQEVTGAGSGAGGAVGKVAETVGGLTETGR